MVGFVRYIATFLFAPALIAASASISAAPFIDPKDDPEHLKALGNIRTWTPNQQVAAFRNYELITPTRRIVADGTPFPLPEAPRELGQVLIETDGETLTVDEYFSRQDVAGLLVIKDGRILYERYGLGNTKETKWVSYSVAKSVVSMLVGAAIKDGYIVSVDERVTDYLPRLKGSPYDATSIRDLLQMSSGVLWDEAVYENPEADINKVPWSALGMYEYMKTLEHEHEPGTVFNYNTAETRIVGNLLRAAIGNNLSFYLTEKIWRPFGMESDANWILTAVVARAAAVASARLYGTTAGLVCLHLRKEDWRTEAAFLPEGWMSESTSPSRASEGYGYFWWLASKGVYEASGIHGQGIRIDTNENVVIALHSARAIASEDSAWALQEALYEALTRAVSD